MPSKRFPNAAPWWKKIAFGTIYQWTASWRKLPDFIIIGVQKSGTSSLYRYLEGHPGLKMSWRKQLHFFDQFYRKGIRWYRACFPLIATNRSTKTGEATPYYILHPHAAERMARHLPDIRLIVMLRNPIDRAYSHFQMKKDQGWETAATFEEAMDLEEDRLRPELDKMLSNPHYYSKQYRNFSYLTRGHYAEQLERWFNHFRREQLLIINSDRFFADPMAVLRETYEFLGLADHVPDNLKVYNQRQYEPMEPALREKLRAYYAPHNEKLYALLGERYDWD
ncbi:MAG: sulfotransferase domain-containing protein [Saprospiraceae bacterium]|nr:sulfotransferase domain-containing protein [Saprospiraceae bacterium]MCB0623895.1 sulfotransferase domain-containing protein [Saprospiraceae bacterium]MCB0678316.1 sulfotransferase domain-containing protein [Saprospiraceae bacterium]MCB0680336.1 sulfotransferase domain-containing protein [Saprospiraceae bacterium]